MSAAAPGHVAIVIIAAVAENDVIGHAGSMPWRLKSDLQRFRALTMGKPVVMGRKTYLSIGKPLEGRTNIVVSRDPSFMRPGIIVTASLQAAMDAARGDALRRSGGSIMIIGGAELYRQSMPFADRLELTRVKARPDGDAHFPPVTRDQWRETARADHPAGPDDEAGFTFESYDRVVTPLSK